MQKAQGYSNTRTYDLVLTSILIALVFVATVFLNIKLPITANGGLIHLGTAMLFLASILFGPKKGAIAGAVGMAIFDLMAGWVLWAPFTLVTRGLQGYLVGKLAWSKDRQGNSFAVNLLATLLSVPIMLVGYYLCEWILYGNAITPFASIPGNLVQNAVGIAISLPLSAILKKMNIAGR